MRRTASRGRPFHPYSNRRDVLPTAEGGLLKVKKPRSTAGGIRYVKEGGHDQLAWLRNPSFEKVDGKTLRVEAMGPPAPLPVSSSPGCRWRVGICAASFAAVLAAALPASSQITTGSVSGTVKDPQGGVIPGATVVLISEARGTRSEPVVTNAAGDFVFPNVTGRHLHDRGRRCPSFKHAQADRRPGERRVDASTVGILTIEVGGASARRSTVKGETPVIQAASGERSFTIPTEIGRRTCRSRTAGSRRWRRWRPASTRHERPRRHRRRRQSTNIMMDGVSTHGHRQQHGRC